MDKSDETKKEKVFMFNDEKDVYKETQPVYYEILEKLGIKNPQEYIDRNLPKGKRNGVMFNELVKNLLKDDVERRQKAAEALGKVVQDDKVSPYVKAYLAEMSGEYIPFDTVLTAGIMVGNGKSLQMGCGEGKTGVLAMAAYAKLSKSENTQVFLTSSTSILATEALDKLDFYNRLGMADRVTLITSEGITRAAKDEETGEIKLDKDGKVIKETIEFKGKSEDEIKELLTEAYKSPLVSSDNATLMQHAMKGYLQRPQEGINRELLSDEADFVLLDSYRPMQQVKEMPEEEMKTALEQRKIAHELLKSVINEKDLYVKDDENQYADFTEAGKEKIVELINQRFGNDESIDKNKIYDYMYDALVVETVYKENRDYQILNNGKKIISEDRASGVAIDLPEGIKQALEIKLQSEGKYVGNISEEKQVIDTLNVQSFFRDYFNGTKHFVSGTLGIDSEAIAEELKENFNVSKEEGDIYGILPKGESQREDQGKHMFSNKSEKRKAILDNALEELKKDRPVLIGIVSEEEIIALQEELQTREFEEGKPRVLIYTAASEEIFVADKEQLSDEDFNNKYGVARNDYKTFSDLIKKEAGKKNTITLGTSIIGRGTTIKTDKTVDGAGGIHVIIDGLHETSSRNQEQFKARTARGTDKGTTKEFFCLDDIPEEFREEFKGKTNDADEVYKSVYKRIDARQSSIRHFVVEFVKLTQDQISYIDGLQGIPGEKKNEIKALVMARAFSIKNRACGVSERFQENIEQYEKEIEAYTEMYICKYESKEKKFDENKWLQENGYEDISRKHMPFSREREKGIFTLAGIKNQAMSSTIADVKGQANATRENVKNNHEQQQEMEGEERL